MSQGNWGGGGGGGDGGWGAPPPGAPPGGGGYGPPPGGGGYGPPPGGSGYGPPPGGPQNPYAPPGFAPQPAGYPPGYTPPTGGGMVAWEDKSRGLFGRWWGTVKEVLLNGRAFHGASAQSDDPWPSVTFAMTTGAFVGLVQGLFVAILYGAIGGIGALGVGSKGGRGAGGGAAVFGVLAAMGIAAAILMPIFYVIGGLVVPWIFGGLNHLALAMLGGTSRAYSSTVRITGYTTAAWVSLCVPGVGGLIAIVLIVMSMALGLDETHKSGMGKAIAAAIIPFILVCLCYCGCYALMLFMGVAASKH
jgi:hypothetical protein